MATKNSAPTISAKIIRQLQQDGMTLKQIGELIGRSESFISLVGKGKRSLTINRLLAIEKALGKPLPLMILEASKECLSGEMKHQYETLYKILKEAGNLHESLGEKGRR